MGWVALAVEDSPWKTLLGPQLFLPFTNRPAPDSFYLVLMVEANKQQNW